ncbi:MAG: helix-turn-helix transcriptional regulator, partial [Firmicutes bacterium]|nr:helix-turn-helix transcriptional regulator [Bacillota bacterium]
MSDERNPQAQLAEAIFVSRSTVAKWENGLGLPGKASMEALEALFAIT